ncbi:hypothetical protein RJ640_001775 [Escallonia rubra]|uniref:Non-haem dioxygenase N-terminal domain-containing protein n=1 Tax=Escallonia rubra TaxID=112253 RepID=A0AA88R9P5_9ASTE|nr:hypothetical protein RJ640_001775 [Escallonia rubra]
MTYYFINESINLPPTNKNRRGKHHEAIPSRSEHPKAPTVILSKMASIKVLAESPNLLDSIPSEYAYSTNHDTPIASNHDDSIPVIDYSLLTSGIPDQRSKVIDELGKACEEWGFFLVKIKLAAAMDKVEENVVATEVAIEVDMVHAVDAMHEDVVDNALKEAKQVMVIKYIA